MAFSLLFVIIVIIYDLVRQMKIKSFPCYSDNIIIINRAIYKILKLFYLKLKSFLFIFKSFLFAFYLAVFQYGRNEERYRYYNKEREHKAQHYLGVRCFESLFQRHFEIFFVKLKYLIARLLGYRS